MLMTRIWWFSDVDRWCWWIIISVRAKDSRASNLFGLKPIHFCSKSIWFAYDDIMPNSRTYLFEHLFPRLYISLERWIYDNSIGCCWCWCCCCCCRCHPFNAFRIYIYWHWRAMSAHSLITRTVFDGVHFNSHFEFDFDFGFNGDSAGEYSFFRVRLIIVSCMYEE